MIVMELEEVFNNSKDIFVYSDGAKKSYTANDGQFEVILNGWYDMIDGARLMPAFGVSLNNETVSAMQKGLWVEFAFDGVQEYNEMPFEKLLVSVAQGFEGFNIIRYNSDGGYWGRCFYYDLVGKNMDDFYELLSNL